MIIAERKPFEEIKNMLSGYKKILVTGCGTCTTICWAGGEKEVTILSSLLKLASSKDGKELTIIEDTVERQCEEEMVIERLKEKLKKPMRLLAWHAVRV